jgi:2-polyprenyl-3-methyl-5-hydroxy-6-metoxy-1,4-benzoquinol methylase
MLARFDRAASLLDVPCGAGRFAETIAPGPRRRVVFADASQAMLDASRAALEAAGCGSVDLRLEDVTKGTPDGRFDVVLCVRLLHHLEKSEDFEAALDYLVKGASLGIICSFASSSTWKGWWRLRRPTKRSSETLRSRKAMARAFAARGWRIRATRCVSFVFSTQTWLLLVPETR